MYFTKPTYLMEGENLINAPADEMSAYQGQSDELLGTKLELWRGIRTELDKSVATVLVVSHE